MLFPHQSSRLWLVRFRREPRCFQNDSLTVTLTSALARRIFLADLGLDVQFEGGRISSYSYNAQSGELGVEMSSDGLSETI